MRESSSSEKEGDARRLLKLREGDIARGVPITPKIGRIVIDELLEDVVNDYRMNGQKSTSICSIESNTCCHSLVDARRLTSQRPISPATS
jgi:hypothetical protein